MAVPKFSLLWTHYPDGTASDVTDAIGGKIDAGFDGNWITDTCAIRMSRAFNYSGAPIPFRRSGLLVVSGADGKAYALRVHEFRRYLTDRFGQPTLSVGGMGRGKGLVTPDQLGGKQGVAFFDWGSAAGGTQHLDVFDGTQNKYNNSVWGKATLVELWVG